MSLPELEPLLERLRTWAGARPVHTHQGALTPGPSFPVLSIQVGDPADLDAFCALADLADVTTLFLRAPVVTEEDWRFATENVTRREDPNRASLDEGFQPTGIRPGMIYELDAMALTAGAGRAIRLHARADWADDFIALTGHVVPEGPA